ESGVVNSIDPLGGSYLVEHLTNQMEKGAYDYFAQIDSLGGVIPALQEGFFFREISASGYRYQREIDSRERIVVGVNDHVSEEPPEIPILQMDIEGERRHLERLDRVRRERSQAAVSSALSDLRRAAEGKENLMPHILDAVRAYATLGEVCGALREVFGEYIVFAMV
ncbi:MAG: methylmalonyl-CoA mutase family protein, partial [Chloroflexota bacterium]|nr:methylmalonyl-CoA mutase family protein [Chloroflexota bacterium]